MQQIQYDERRPCQPIVTPSLSREELRQEARNLEIVCDAMNSGFVPNPRACRSAVGFAADIGGEIASFRNTSDGEVIVSVEVAR